MKLRRKHIIAERFEEKQLHIPTEISEYILSFVYPELSILFSENVWRVDCDAIMLLQIPIPERGRSSKHDSLTCNNEACATKCAWYERNGQAFERCSADRVVNSRGGRRELFCNKTWCTTLYKDNGGILKQHFSKLRKRERIMANNLQKHIEVGAACHGVGCIGSKVRVEVKLNKLVPG